jgi:hypothetical protein
MAAMLVLLVMGNEKRMEERWRNVRSTFHDNSSIGSNFIKWGHTHVHDETQAFIL